MNSEGEYTLCNLDTHSYANSFSAPDLSNTIFAANSSGGGSASAHPGYPHHPHHQGLGHAAPSSHSRSLDTGQGGYPGLHYGNGGPPHNDGTMGTGGVGNGEMPTAGLATTPQSLGGGYPLHTSATLRAAAAATRGQHHALSATTSSHYGHHLPDLALATATDCYMNGATNGNLNVSHHPHHAHHPHHHHHHHHNGQNMCMDISAAAGMRGAYHPCPPDGVRGVSTPNGSPYLQTVVTPSSIKTEGCGGGSAGGGGMQSLHNKPFRWMTIKRNAPKPGEWHRCFHKLRD